MAIADRTRADLRTALQYHTDSKLTSSTDQDYYLNQAELDVFKEWRKFDPGLFRPVQQSGATDSSGILLLDAEFTRLEFLEDGSHNPYEEVKDMRNVAYATGFFFAGFDQSANKRQVKVIRGGSPLASTTLYWYNIEQMLMGSGGTVKSAIPNECRHLITYRAAFLYYQDKGPAFLAAKNAWREDYLRELSDAYKWYKNVSKSPQFVTSLDPDAGMAQITVRQS